MSIVRRVDHLNIVVPRPRALFDFLTQRLELPVERPWARFPAFESGQAMLGIGYEPITYAPGRRTHVPPNAGFFAIAFEPEPIEQALGELASRAIPHSLAYEFSVTYADEPGTFALDELAGPGRRRRRWTLVTIGGLLGAETSLRPPSRGAATLGKALGRLGSGPLGGVLVARLGSSRPFCFLCEFHSFDVARSRAVTADELARRGGGPLGLVRTREIIVTARDAAAESERWQPFLVTNGPAITLIEGPQDGIQAVIWEVESLAPAADWLRGHGWLGQEGDGTIALAAEPLHGLDIRLVSRSG